MLKKAYEIMYKAAEIKILTLSKLVRLQNDEIQELKRENEELKKGNKYANLGQIVPTQAKKINFIA